MKYYYHPSYSALDLPPHHRFPIAKYQLLHQRIDGHPSIAAQWHCAQPASQEQIALCHTFDYLNGFIKGTLDSKAQKRIGFPYSEALVERTMQSVGNSIAMAQTAMQDGVSINLGGGYHHAYSTHGSGYCIFNDLAIAAKVLINDGLAERVLLVDLDVHQGDGSAEILQGDTDIITLSLHGEQNFPRIKQQSDYDFALPTGCADEHYLETLEQALQLAIRLHQPDIILYNAGADVYSKDELGVLSLSLKGVRARDDMVINRAKQHNIPLGCALGGGYQKDVSELVNVHWQLIAALENLNE